MVKLLLLFSILFFSINISASIVDTKHNLSVSGTGTIKAQTETEVCVFCHIPHAARPTGKPLWNRSLDLSTTYAMYDSDYLRRMNYPPVAIDLGIANGQPGLLSRQCLSCHDGTVAVGAVYKLRRDVLSTDIPMYGVNGAGQIASSAAFGTDLKNHHPVGIEYDPGATFAFSDVTRGMELKAISVVEAEANVKLYDYAGTKYVECSSCHDPHKNNDMFLHVSGGTHAQNVVNTCISCHEKTGWNAGIHNTSTVNYVDADGLVNAKYGTTVVGELGCANCHTPHNSESSNYLNRKIQATTCYQGAASSIPNANCHGAGGIKDLQKVFLEKSFGHPVGDESTPELHTNLDVIYGTGVLADDAAGISWDTNKHAVCMDCHNPHQAQKGTHVTAGGWYGVPSLNGNDVSPALTGVTGVDMPSGSWPTTWTQPKNFAIINSATKEWQICLKCHSYWGMGDAIWGINTNSHESDSVPGQLLTDVAWEMNQNNRSGHPVIFPNNAAGRPGGYSPEELADVQLISPWITNRGNQTMYCSDCHGSDTEDQPGHVKGPHGSDLAYLLKGDNHSWPLRGPLGGDAGGAPGDFYTLADIQNGNTADLFCKNCHDIGHPHDKWRNQMSGKEYSCVMCHVAIPHGSQISRLIGYKSFPAPYNYQVGGVGQLEMTGWVKKVYNPLDTGQRQDAWTDASNTCVNGMGTVCHGSVAAAYDTLDVLP